MNPRLTRGEYWILQTAVEGGISLCHLNAANYKKPDGVEVRFNKPSHGLDREHLLDALMSLLDQGWIQVKRENVLIDVSRNMISAALDRTRKDGPPDFSYYLLTQQGGAAWEAFAAPDWERFTWCRFSIDPNEGTLAGASSSRIDEHLQGIELFNFEIDQNSIERREIEPWEATYWKTLPRGFEARFRWLRRKEYKWRPASDPLRYAFGGYCAWSNGWYRWR